MRFLQIVHDAAVAVQVAGQGDVAQGSQALGARDRVLAEAERFGEDQHARAAACRRLEDELASHREAVGLIGQRLVVHVRISGCLGPRLDHPAHRIANNAAAMAPGRAGTDQKSQGIRLLGKPSAGGPAYLE